MLVVSNTSPILNLAIIGQLTLLRDQFQRITIPPAVVEELRVENNLPGSEVIRNNMQAGWIRVVKPQDDAFLQILNRKLGAGESEAIALALQLAADRILLDEREARKLARSLGLNVNGVLGVLLRCSWENGTSPLETLLLRLRQEAGFWISDTLMTDLLEADRTRKNRESTER